MTAAPPARPGRGAGRWRFADSWRGRGWAALIAVDALVLLPFVLFAFPPGMDLPNHLAVARVAFDLAFEFSTPAADYYALNPQSTPYHLAYVFLGPPLRFFSPLVAARVVLGLLAALTLAASHWTLRALEAPAIAHGGVALVFFGASFFWGFVPMQFGLLGAVVAVGALGKLAGRFTQGDACLAAAGTLWACISHILWWAPLALVWGIALSFMCSQGRKAWAWGGLWGATALLLPVAPWMVEHLFPWGAGALSSVSATFDSPEQALHHLKVQAGLFDRSVGRVGHYLIIGVFVFLAGLALRRRRDAPSRFARRAAIASFCLALFGPVALRVGDDSAWGINFRYYAFALICLLGATVAPRTMPWRGIVTGGVGLGVALWTYGLFSAWSDFGEEARRVQRALEQVPKEAALIARGEQLHFAHFWPNVDTHLPTLHVAGGGAFVNTVFAGGHIPIMRRRGAAPCLADEPCSPSSGCWSAIRCAAAAAAHDRPASQACAIEGIPRNRWRLEDMAASAVCADRATAGAHLP